MQETPAAAQGMADMKINLFSPAIDKQQMPVHYFTPKLRNPVF